MQHGKATSVAPGKGDRSSSTATPTPQRRPRKVLKLPLSRAEIESLANDLGKRLERDATAKTRAFWNRYLKGELSFRGVPMRTIRSGVNAFWAERHLDDVRFESQRALALHLLTRPLGEDKIAGILILELKLIKGLGVQDLPAMAKLFDQKHIADWSTTDWMAVKVLAKLLKFNAEPSKMARAIAGWRKSSNLWQRRAAAVAFVPSAKLGNRNFSGFVDVCLSLANALLRDMSAQRFAQTGAGWLLRELWLGARVDVERFLRDTLALWSREGIRCATEKMPKARRGVFLVAHEQATGKLSAKKPRARS